LVPLLLLLTFLSPTLTQTTLRQAAQGKHFYMGSAVNAGTLHSGETLYNQTLTAQYNLVTAENGCKWGATEPQRGRFDYSQCDTVYNYAKSAGSVFRGHNLCWGEGNPSWLQNGGLSPADKRAALTNHIQNVIKRYTDVVGWDVVNEAVSDSGTNVLKPTVWYPDVPDYIDVAFTTARAANPNVKLFYNDYNIASSTGWSAAKSQKVYDMVKSMKQRGIPIDGVGLQLHIDLTYDLVDGVRQNMQRLADLGLEIHITELDIGCAQGTCSGWDTQKAQQQANLYVALLKVCMAQPKCTNFETWGFTDKHTWRNTDEHPLPFDENYKGKPAFTSMLQTLVSGQSLVE